MAFNFKLPDIGEGIHEGELVKWFVKEGDEVKEDDVLCEIQNDKSVVEIPSQVDGTVTKIHVAEGEVAIVGDTLISFDAEGYDDEEEEETKSEDTSSESKEEKKQMTMLHKNQKLQMNLLMINVSLRCLLSVNSHVKMM